jgi:putative membrane protein
MLQGGNLIAHFIMKKTHLLLIVSFLACAPALLAADSDMPFNVPSWHAQTLLAAIGNVLIFAAIGIVAAILGFKVFDKCTPGHLEKEIIEHRNVAAAIVAAAVIIGVSIIIAASMLG